MNSPQPSHPPDRRVARTRQALHGAMMALLAETAWEDLSIQALCDAANVGRSTFYLHYDSKEDLLAEGLAQLRKHLAALPAGEATSSLPLLDGLLSHMAEQRAVFKAVIGRRGGQGIASRFKAMLRELLAQALTRRGLHADQLDWLSHFLAGGIVEAMAWWVDAAEAPPVQELASRLDLQVRAALEWALTREDAPPTGP